MFLAIIATEINKPNSIINFYDIEGIDWKLIGSEKMNIPIYKIDFDDLKGNDLNEIVISTSPNMNGNKWLEVYSFSINPLSIKYAGSFSTNYVVDKQNQKIFETYEGSHYMDASKTIYKWNKGQLISKNKVIISRQQVPTVFEMYENSSNKIHELRPVNKQVFENNDKNRTQLWNNFFKLINLF